MITDDKKEEIRQTADIVEVVGDYVKLKKSGSGFVGLCPFHSEKTPSFHVTPQLGIYKCFGCGESGDVFSFVMAMEGVSFPESLRSLADRYGIDIPDEHTDGDDEQTRLREGIYHALKFAGLFFYRQLLESEKAATARSYLHKRGYEKETIRSFGLGYAPPGSELLKAAQTEGIPDEYLLRADLIKPDSRGDGYYDTFRDRLMFPIFNPSGKVIAFAGRILDESKKTAKYINSAQTPVYNKSEVVYGINFAKNEIRKEGEVILVEGYTDVITMNRHGIKNVVASSGTSLTPGQIKILQRYGNRIVMIYDADSAGQAAMQRGMNIALEQGMEVFLLELPEKEDPDSFVKQFGRDSFLDYKRKRAEDFVTFTILKAEKEGDMERPGGRSSTIRKILESIALIPEELERQVFIQHLHQKTQKYRKGSDRELFQQMEKILSEKKQKKQYKAGSNLSAPPAYMGDIPDIRDGDDYGNPQSAQSLPEQIDGKDRFRNREQALRKKPHYEMELIRLMLRYGENMIRFIGHNVAEDHFEDEELKAFYADIINRHVKGEKVTIEHYTEREAPYPTLLGDILLERYTLSEKHAEKTGSIFKRDKNPFKTAKSTLKPLHLYFFERKRKSIAIDLKNADGEEKARLMKLLTKVQKEISRIQKTPSDELFEDPDFIKSDPISDKNGFEYKMKGEGEG
ncbi:DNA primase [Rhodohalobacter mucosus]|uniref:DNA primase n=1 Tax=Rhodohalobacter mucosus TaxID=2079485 RepID=A0A316TSV1_9BACT|nr:DNA primase [Rhodohalobacter mucosus]PWN07657.1 DNA primase [Rhodohalobacter mucosus]